MATGIFTKIFDADKVDRIIEVSEEEASHDQTFGARGRNFAGMSSGGSVATAVKIAEELDSGVIVLFVTGRSVFIFSLFD
jgi:cysteine synthase B